MGPQRQRAFVMILKILDPYHGRRQDFRRVQFRLARRRDTPEPTQIVKDNMCRYNVGVVQAASSSNGRFATAILISAV